MIWRLIFQVGDRLGRYDHDRPKKAGFFSLIRIAAATSKRRKTQVASVKGFGSLAHFGGKPAA
jgi:hypothetical protein